MSQPVHIACPHCAQNLKVAGATAGKQVRCPQCHGIVRVPDPINEQPHGPTRWMVRTDDGKLYGPVPRAELEQWVEEGRIHAQCHITPEGAQQWIWAAEMFPQLSVPPPPTAARATVAYAHSYHTSGPVSDKSKLVAGLLGLLLPVVGLYGVHRLYTGHIALGILMLITCGGCGIWQLIDVILVFAGSVTDAEGRPLRD